MTTDQVLQIIGDHAFPHPSKDAVLIETHISMVILTDNYVYKIKKPLKFSFLDFSTVKLREKYCHREVLLNSRLAKDMYLGVLPVTKDNEKIYIGTHTGEIIDYAVLMKRMDETKQMDILLKQAKVSHQHILSLVDILTHFHQGADIIDEGEDWEELYEEFADLKNAKQLVSQQLSQRSARMIDKVNAWSYNFLYSIKYRIDQRNNKGFVIDGHGDLHSRNIFLMEKPVIFDCIEFNDDFRKLDILSEIAFICMDLERFGRDDLSKLFYNRYFSKIQCIENKTDEQLFLFYKLYRANVMIKVHAIKAKESTISENQFHTTIQLVKDYFRLFESYYHELLASTSKVN